MSSSLVQLVQDLQRRVAKLEDERLVRHMAPKIEAMKADIQEQLAPKSERKMCPKCGVKPNYFFHVKNCAGTQKEEQIDATDGPGLKHSTR